MSARKRLQQAEAEEREPKCRPASGDQIIKFPEINTCKYIIEIASPKFDPNGVLLHRVFFINEDKPRYVSVGFYPSQNYQTDIEFGGSRIKPVILMDQHVTTMAECLPRICVAMYDDGQFACSDGSFRLIKTGSYLIARLYIKNNT